VEVEEERASIWCRNWMYEELGGDLCEMLEGTDDAYHGMYLLAYRSFGSALRGLVSSIPSFALYFFGATECISRCSNPTLSAASCETILPLAMNAAPTTQALRHFLSL